MPVSAHDTNTAHQGVQHDDMNVFCLGSEIVGKALAAEILDAFAAAEFNVGDRHVQRLLELEALSRGE